MTWRGHTRSRLRGRLGHMADLLPLPEGLERAPVVVAHPDDRECGGSGAVAWWTAQGREVVHLIRASADRPRWGSRAVRRYRRREG
ncbi:hypothetical protein WY02_13000 [Pseudonocardia sp. AL041005-10]|nr:hypothetical protein WY02_13000 [Pseudonocardia sp. AL041005-10]